MATKRGVSLTLTGVPELDAKLKKLETKAGNRIARNSLGAGARAVQKSIKNLASPKIKKSVGMRNEKGRKSARLETKVGINVGKRGGRTEFKRWAPLSVLGSVNRKRQKLGGKFAYVKNPTEEQLSTGQIKASQIVKRGYAAAQGSMNAAMKKAFDRSLAREVAKAQLKGK